MSWETSWDEEGWWTRIVRYDDQVFSARCPDCARFVKTDESAKLGIDFGGVRESNATCKKHGRVSTPFLAWAGDCS